MLTGAKGDKEQGLQKEKRQEALPSFRRTYNHKIITENKKLSNFN